MLKKSCGIVLVVAGVLAPALAALGQNRTNFLSALAQLASGGSSSGINEGATLKTVLQANAEEWKVIGPALRRVIVTRTVLATIDPDQNLNNPSNPQGMRRGLMNPNDPFGGPGPVATGGGNRGRSAGAAVGPQTLGASSPPDPAGASTTEAQAHGVLTYPVAMAELQAALDNPDITDKQLAEVVKRVHAARQRALAEFRAAEGDLVKLLTPDQEATLIVLGYIE